MAQTNSQPRRNITYLSLSSDGYMYTKATKEEYENQGPDGNIEEVRPLSSDPDRVFYHRIFSKTEEGYISRFRKRETDYGDVIEISVQNEDSIDVIQWKMESANGNYRRHTATIATLMPGVDLTRRLTIAFDRKKKKEEWGTGRIWINYVDATGNEDRPELKYLFGKDVPAPEKITRKGKEETDFQKRDDFLWGLLEKEFDRVSEFAENQLPALLGTQSTPSPARQEVSRTPAPESAPAPTKEPTPEPAGAELPDDLPF